MKHYFSYFITAAVALDLASSFQTALRPRPFSTKNAATLSSSDVVKSSLSRTAFNTNRPLTLLFSATAPSSSSSSTTNPDPETKEDSDEDEGVGAWIPLASIKGLTGLGPQRITVMGIDLVVWHTEADEKKGEEMVWSAQVDACTHRLAPLSQGRVDPTTNCVECPYHGWQFDSEGCVTSIPQLDPNKNLQSVQKTGGNVQTFPVHASGDLLFVFLPSSLHGEMFPQSLLPEDYYPHLSIDVPKDKQIFARELPYSFDFLVENFMDPAHIPFAHHKLQGTRDDSMPIAITETFRNFTHVEVAFKDVSAKRARDAWASFQRPAYYHFGEFMGDPEIKDRERKLSLGIYIAPVSAGRCRIFFNTPLPRKIPAALSHAGSNRFLNSDTWLHDTERTVERQKEEGLAGKKPNGMNYIYASKSDTGVTAFRRWWSENGMADAPPHTFAMATMEQLGPKTLSRYEQIDPWESHAKHCAACRRTLENLKKGQGACLVLAILCGALLRQNPIVGALGVGVSLYGRNFLKKFATTIEGNPEISGVGDRSSSASAD